MTSPSTLCAPRRRVTLSPQEVARYSRHLIMPEVGMEGQKRLKAASVLLIGAGGLGSPLGLYLAAAGVGRIGLVDFDVVDFSNLQRQVLHGTPDVGRPKLHSARDRLQAINPEVRVDLYETRLTSANALDIFEPYDIIIDGTDNFPTRYLVNDACVLLKKPNVYGSIFRFDGQASVFYPAARPVLSLPVPGAAAARRGAELRRGRRAGHPAGPDRLHPGDGGGQADPRPGRAADRPAAALRRPADELPRVQGAPQSEVPDVRRPADDHAADRLRAVLRRPRPGSAGAGCADGARNRPSRS